MYKPIASAEKLIYIALYKPRYVLSTVEKERGYDRQTVRELVDLPGQLHPVGRLDYESEGLVLMTNDGDLTKRLTHPRFGHTKEYKVLIARRPDRLNSKRGSVAWYWKMDIKRHPPMCALTPPKEKVVGCV